ncbi:DUF4197 domain-containing protein [Ferriphaselus sp. R-1]|uniref:DUF4197 domain-containing protein n=1 Tax=Ferriphaselus sp. R-1 TaxID=1485544 RepID=UPI000558D58E|nr:DUF4197 domain-containing protein [Ferriphaselus sp. R-1]
MRILLLCVLLLTSPFSQALGLADLSNKDAVSGLKQALTQGAGNAVATLGKADGFLGNPKVKIPLPDSLQQVDKLLRTFGGGKYADELVLTMNRAAEAAVPEAKALLIQSVKDMSVQDAKGILTGGDTAATEYFRGKTRTPLAAKFLPIVQKATEKVGLAQKYDQFAGKAAGYGLLDENQANIEKYVTQKALDGLYLMIAEEEKAIRKDPVGQASNLLSKVFGAIGK